MYRFLLFAVLQVLFVWVFRDSEHLEDIDWKNILISVYEPIPVGC